MPYDALVIGVVVFCFLPALEAWGCLRCWTKRVSCPRQGAYVRQEPAHGCLLLAAASCQTTGVFQVCDSAPTLCFLGRCRASAWEHSLERSLSAPRLRLSVKAQPQAPKSSPRPSACPVCGEGKGSCLLDGAHCCIFRQGPCSVASAFCALSLLERALGCPGSGCGGSSLSLQGLRAAIYLVTVQCRPVGQHGLSGLRKF